MDGRNDTSCSRTVEVTIVFLWVVYELLCTLASLLDRSKAVAAVIVVAVELIVASHDRKVVIKRD